MPLISVVVAVYNVADYLDNCVQSLLRQETSDMQIILVDDGSKDRSGEICDSYLGKDDRITVIHQENQGVSVARNTGIEASKGEWITFVDGDDWVDDHFAASLIRTIQSVSQETEMVVFNYYAAEPNATRACRVLPFGEGDITEQRAFFQEKIVSQYYAGSDPQTVVSSGTAWCKMVRKAVLEAGGFRFVPGLIRAQDTVFWLNVSNAVKRIYLLNENLYYYRLSSSSICSGKKYLPRCEEPFGTLLSKYEEFGEKNYPQDKNYLQALHLRTVQVLMWYIDHKVFNENNPSSVGEKAAQLKKLAEEERFRIAIAAAPAKQLPKRLQVMLAMLRGKRYKSYYYVNKIYNRVSEIKNRRF